MEGEAAKDLQLNAIVAEDENVLELVLDDAQFQEESVAQIETQPNAQFQEESVAEIEIQPNAQFQEESVVEVKTQSNPQFITTGNLYSSPF